MTNTSTTTRTEALAARLPSVDRDRAGLSRIVFDARCERWLRERLGREDVFLRERALDTDAVLDLRCEWGTLQLAIDAASRPALSFALALPDTRLACAVAAQLLAAEAGLAADALPGLELVDRQVGPPACRDGFTLVCADMSVALLSIDDRFAAHLRRAIGGMTARGRGDIPARLRLRPRLRLAERRWTRRVIASIEPDDIVLLAPAAEPLGGLLLVGQGTRFCAAATYCFPERTVNLVDEPYLAQDDAPDAIEDAPAAPLDLLEVPVSFEVDTARIALGELTAMRPGSTLELDVPASAATVRLVCHGQTLGHGQLVVIGDHLGVRITRMQHIDDGTR